MKKGKLTLAILGAVIVILAAGVFYLLQNLDSLVEAAIEKYGSQAAGTRVRVQSVDIGLKEGRGSVLGLTVANPEGFSREPIFTLGEITLDLDTSTLASEVPVIEEIRIGASSFRYEVDAQIRSNLDVLKANLQGSSRARKGTPLEKGGKEEKPLRIKVKRLTIASAKGILDLTLLGGKVEEATLPPLTLTNLGGKEGITPEALGETVLAAMVKNLEQTAARKGAEQALRGKLGEAGRKVDEKLGEGAGEALKNLLGQ